MLFHGAMRIGKTIGLVFSAGAATAIILDVIGLIEKGSYLPLKAGEIWALIDRPSLNLTQAGIERYVAPWLWDPVMLTLLTSPLWLVLAIPGLFFLLVSRWRHRLRETP